MLIDPIYAYALVAVAFVQTVIAIWMSRAAGDWRHRAKIAERKRDEARHALRRGYDAAVEMGCQLADANAAAARAEPDALRSAVIKARAIAELGACGDEDSGTACHEVLRLLPRFDR